MATLKDKTKQRIVHNINNHIDVNLLSFNTWVNYIYFYNNIQNAAHNTTGKKIIK